MEKFLLRPLFPREELNVVDQEHVDVSIAPSQFHHFVVANRVDDFIGELLGRDVRDSEVAFLHDEIADGIEEVCFAQANAPVNKERVIGKRRRFGDFETCRMSKLVTGPHHKILEGIFRIRHLSLYAGLLGSGRQFVGSLTNHGR